jgi:two-component system NarL family sensor kinase
LGVLNVASTDWQQLSPEDLRLLYTVGDLLSIAIERARLFARRAELGAVEERNRLAREIHDTLAQGLAGIALQLETADALLENNSDPQRARLAVNQALSLARENLEEARRSVLDLRAAPLEGHTLGEALEALSEMTSSQNKIQVAYQVTGSNQPLPARVEVGLYRMAQEALSNVVRHANADQAVLRLTITPTQAELVIEDDGRGFDPLQLAEGHFGLIGLNERARLLGGRLNLNSSPGQGTRLTARVPLKE